MLIRHGSYAERAPHQLATGDEKARLRRFALHFPAQRA
jgi:hypothetical protein